MLNKIALTQQLIEQLRSDIALTLDEAMNEWWKNPDKDAGLRLTTEGFFVFDLLKIDHYEFDVPASYIFLGKKPKLLLFGSKEATMYSLYGDIDKFLKGLARG